MKIVFRLLLVVVVSLNLSSFAFAQEVENIESVNVEAGNMENMELDAEVSNTPSLVVEYVPTQVEIWEDGSVQEVEIGSEETGNVEEKSEVKKWFFWIMLPAALADSINPCAFAVMLILLSAILKKSNSRKKAVFAGILFALTIFVVYFLIGLGLLNVMASTENTYILKLIVWIVWILVWLANLKDYFLPNVWPKMEVPEAWKPKMHKITASIVSPVGAIGIGIIVSLFLLPCTSWPYITILWYLSTENVALSWYIYLFLYNLIFILPMLVIVVLVGTGAKKVEKLARMRKDNVNLLHLIVWLLMLGLGIYVLMTI